MKRRHRSTLIGLGIATGVTTAVAAAGPLGLLAAIVVGLHVWARRGSARA